MDAMIKLIYFMKDTKGIEAVNLSVKDLTKEIIVKFLEWIQTETVKFKKNKKNTRNIRLIAVKKFFEYVSDIDPNYLLQFQKIDGIKRIRTKNGDMPHMTLEQVRLLLQQPDARTEKGFRDLVLLSLMYDSGARVQEIADLTPINLRMTGKPTIELIGKGKKGRLVAISESVKVLLQKYLKETGLNRALAKMDPLFSNPWGKKLSRQGIFFLVRKYLQMAKKKNPLFDITGMGCHTFRHSRATHWVEGGMPLAYVAANLGHSYETTLNAYVKVNMKQKRNAFDKAHRNVAPHDAPKWKGRDFVSHLRTL